MREGYLDIEASQLKADFGHVISWALKPRGKPILFDVLRRRTLAEERRILQTLLVQFTQFDRLYTYYGCLTAGHRVLTADLLWEPVETLQAGDRLLTISEQATPRHKWEAATVVHNVPFSAPVYVVHLETGQKVECTGDHPWLCSSGSGWHWVKTSQLRRSQRHSRLVQILTPWTEPSSYWRGWLSGFADGEGCISQNDGERGPHLTVALAQVEGPTLERAKAILEQMGFDTGVYAYDPQHRRARTLVIRGGKEEVLHFLGSVRPERLLAKLNLNKLGAVRSKFPRPTPRVVGVEPAGVKTVWGLGTTSQTYISDGFVSHNSRFDIPFLRTRCEYHHLPFPSYMDLFHTDLYDVVKWRFRLHSNRLQVAESFLLGTHDKTPLDPEVWVKASFGDPKAFRYILDHNIKDAKVLERLHRVIEPYMRATRRSI